MVWYSTFQIYVNNFKLSLEVIKNGVVIEEIALENKPFYLAGKLPDLCDIVLEHPSISRKHGVL